MRFKEFYTDYILENNNSDIDKEYLDAVEVGDEAKVQQMIDNASQASSYKAVGYRAGFYTKGVASLPSSSGNLGASYYAILGGDLSMIQRYAREQNDQNSDTEQRVEKVYIDVGNKMIGINSPAELNDYIDNQGLLEFYNKWLDLQHTVNDSYRKIGSDRPDSLETRRAGNLFRRTPTSEISTSDSGKMASFLFDRNLVTSIIINWDADNNMEGRTGTEIGVANPSQIKSADLVTYDSKRNIIPLSKRFNSESNDVRY